MHTNCVYTTYSDNLTLLYFSENLNIYLPAGQMENSESLIRCHTLLCMIKIHTVGSSLSVRILSVNMVGSIKVKFVIKGLAFFPLS